MRAFSQTPIPCTWTHRNCTPVQEALSFDGAANTIVNGAIAAPVAGGPLRAHCRNNGTTAVSLAIGGSLRGRREIPDSVSALSSVRDRPGLVRVVRGRRRSRVAGQPGQ